MTSKIKAVVIDDVKSCRDILTAMLEDRDYDVTAFSSAELFVTHCRAGKQCPHEVPCIDLLLTDQQMPRLTGLELIAAQREKNCKLLVNNCAVLSGAWSPDDLQKAESLGCRSFSKPYLHGFNDWLDKWERTFVQLKPS